MTKMEGQSRFSKWLRRLIYAMLIVVFLAAVLVALVIWYKPSPFQLVLAGKSVDIGASYGRELKTPMRLVNRFYLERVLCQNNPKLIQGSRAAALRTLPNWPKQYREELEAAAAASGVPVGALAFGNSFLDLGGARAGCRSVVIAQTNAVLHAHNLDWDNLGGFGRWTTCIVRRNPTDGRLKTVSVCFPGMIGALDIINEKGLALSFNQLGWGKGGTNEPVLVMVRRIAESCASLGEARAQLVDAPEGMPFIITVSDAPAGTGSVFERFDGKLTERSLQQNFVAACNTAQGTNFGSTRLDQILADKGTHDLAAVRRALADPEVLLECNLYSVVFDFRKNRLWLASGEVPAARGTYREYRLFE